MAGDRPGRSRHAVRPFKWIGKSIGSTARGVWRVVRRRRRIMAPMASISASLMESPCTSQSDEYSEWPSFCQSEPLFQFPTFPAFPTFAAVPNLQLQLQHWFAGLSSGHTTTAPPAAAVAAAAVAPAPTSSSNAARTSLLPVFGGSSSSSSLPQAVHPQQQCDATAANSTFNSSSSSVQLLGEMLNPRSTFPMLLHTVGGSSSSSSEQPSLGSSSTSDGNSSSITISSKPQQLLTVGCRHWSNWLLGNGLLKVKIYDFAIYVDGQQAEQFVPTAASSSGGSSSSSLQDNLQESLPDLLKSHSSGVGMSLILRAARDVPLHMLAEEYEKVLQRRLARAGGDESDSIALQHLLAAFSTPERLPAAVRSGKSTTNPSSSSSSSSDSKHTAAAGNSDDSSSSSSDGGGSVAKGAMLVFERSHHGTVTARVGHHILGAVHSPRLAEALFDLYLGDQPVSEKAKDAAAATLGRMALSSSSSSGSSVAGSWQRAQEDGGSALSSSCSSSEQLAHFPYYLPQSKSERIQCGGLVVGHKGVSNGGAKGASAFGLGLSELAACALHMD